MRIRTRTLPDPDRISPSDLLPAVLAIALGIATIITLQDQDLRFGVIAPQIDTLINEAAALVATFAAGLAWLRFRYTTDTASLFETSAFVLFAGLAVVQLAASLGIGDQILGLDIDEPGQAPVYAWAIVRLIAAALIVRASWLRLHPRSGGNPALVVLAPLAGALAIALALYAAEPYLPAALGTDAIAGLRLPSEVSGVLPGVAALELIFQVVGFGLFMGAAYNYVRAARRNLAPSGRYLGAGLVLAAYSQIHFALFPGAYAGIVSTSDLLRVAFYAFVVFGVAAETGATLRHLRTANRELDELRTADVARASLTERARLAREVHDGLAQDLWVAKLATERLGKAQTMDDVRAIQTELTDVIDASIAEARETVGALRATGNEDAPLSEALGRYARRFARQTGLDVRLDVAPIEPGALSPSAAGELLRIAQEALSNVRKHADATAVDVALRRTADGVELTVRDNGVGFETSARSGGYGLESMRERAQIAGGRMTVDTGPSSGTVVTVAVPAF